MNAIQQETLTSRQRVVRALSHQPVDRVPIDLGAHYSTGISAFAYHRLREYLGLPMHPPEVVDTTQFLARVEEDVLRRFHCDCMLLHPGWLQSHAWTPRDGYTFMIPPAMKPQLQPDGSWALEGTSMSMPAGGYFFENGWLSFYGEDNASVLQRTAREAERIFKETDYFTMYIGFGAFFGDIEFQCKMYTDPDEIRVQNARELEGDLAALETLIAQMGGYVQAVALNSDLGSQTGPFVRPSLYEELCAPYLKKVCSFIHRNTDWKIFLHCCGSIEPLIPILIDCGIDVLNPVQISAANMDPQHLKARYGNDIAFWGGGCDTQHVLPLGTVEDVRENTRALVRAFKPNAGFVFNPVHNIMGDIAPEKIVAMYDTAYEESFY